MSKRDLIEQAIKVWRSERWQEFTTVRDSFPIFSDRNAMRILRRFPDATNVNTDRKWERIGRSVIEGAYPVLTIGRNRFFDISQTEGEPMISPVDILDGEAPEGAVNDLIRYAEDKGLKVVWADLPIGVNGELRWAANELAVSNDISEAQIAKTIAHELGHFLLHRTEVDRSVAEVEAESVAYLVCRHYGLDTAPYSAGYVLSWAGEPNNLKSILNTHKVEQTVIKIVG